MPPIDRPLMTRDLEALSELIGSEIQTRLDALASASLPIPLPFGRSIDLPLGLILQRLPLGSPRQRISDVLGSLLALDDADLAAILDLVGQQLGAWRGSLPPVEPAQLEALAPAITRLAGIVAGQP